MLLSLKKKKFTVSNMNSIWQEVYAWMLKSTADSVTVGLELLENNAQAQQ